MVILSCPSSHLRLPVVLFPLDFAILPLPGVSRAPSHLVMPLCPHTMRVKILLLLVVGTHICMCLQYSAVPLPISDCLSAYFPLDFAISSLPGVSRAPSYLVMPFCLHTMRVKFLLLLFVGTHICMCLSTCMHAAHAHMQVCSNAIFHRIDACNLFYSLLVCIFTLSLIVSFSMRR